MKKDWSKIAVVVSCVLLIICLVQIMDMKQQINNLQNNMSNRISNMESSVQNISSEVYRQMEKEASLLTGSEWTYGERDMENHTVMLQCSVSPKEYQPEVTKAVLLCGDREYAMTLKNGVYTAEIPVPIFTESQVLRVQFKEDGVVRTEELNWYLNPRYECLPTVYAEFGGSSSFSKNEDVFVLDMSGDLNIFMESKGGEFRIEKMYLVEHVEGQERSREEITAEKMSVMDYYYQLEKKIEIPFGCTYDLYLEVVDNCGLVHRSWLEHKVIDEEGNLEEENSDWWYGSEGSLYDAQGEPLYVLENGTVVYAKEAVIKKNSLENYRDYLKKSGAQGTMHTLLRDLTGDEEPEPMNMRYFH